MSELSFADFDKVYQQTVRDVYQHWTTAMQDEIAAHNIGWSSATYSFEDYLSASTDRYYRAYRALNSSVSGNFRVCDVGGFWGVFPLTLKRFGLDVTMTETLKYYSDSFAALFGYLTEQGVVICDYDPFESEEALPGRFDAITIMAVLEHYPHSLRHFMDNVLCALKPEGKLYIEVPNIAYWLKRLQLLRGQTPLPTIRSIYESRIPFTGHHHEFTMRELKDLADLCHLDVIAADSYNYSLSGGRLWRLRQPIAPLIYRCLPDTREVLTITCKRQARLEP